MHRWKRVLLSLAVLAVGPLGCGPSAGDLYDQLVTKSQEAAAVTCNACWAQLAYAAVDPCLAASPGAFPERDSCVDAALRQDGLGSVTPLDCRLAAYTTYERCRTQALAVGCDQAAVQRCDDTWATDVQTCPPLPSVVNSAYVLCTGAAPL